MLSGSDWWDYFLRFLVLSLMSVGGAIATIPEMHRYLVLQKGWLTDPVFASSVALAQAAPGPNVLIVPALGYQVAGVSGALVALLGTLLPSTVLALVAPRWMAARRDTPFVRAFVAGMLPVTLGLLLATGWVLAGSSTTGILPLVVAATALLTWRTKIAPVWLVAAGAILGALGLF
jgi:chromate transporter